MENLERPNYYGQMPANVRYDESLSSSAKLLYAEITALTNKTGTCWASNKYFSDLYKVNVNTISQWVNQLVDSGHITSQINKKAGNRRYLRLSVADPITKNRDTYHEKAIVNNNKTNNSSIVDLEKSKTALLSLVNEVTGRAFRTLPERGVKKTLDAFTLDEIRTALTALVQDGWHRPKLKELSIDYFIRSTTIDKFLGKAPAPGTPKPKGNYVTEDDDGNQYWNGELITPQNQDRITKERMGK